MDGELAVVACFGLRDGENAYVHLGFNTSYYPKKVR